MISFPASDAGYVQICKSQNAECLLEAMQKIFEYIAAVPTIKDLNIFNKNLLHQYDENVKRVHYEKKDIIFYSSTETQMSLKIDDNNTKKHPYSNTIQTEFICLQRLDWR